MNTSANGSQVRRDNPAARKEIDLGSNDPRTAAPALLEKLIEDAAAAAASDIHLQMVNHCAEISFRLDGVLCPITKLGEEVSERLCGRIKYLARLKTYDSSLPQDGRIGKKEIRTENDIRVATYPTVTGEKIVLRLFTGEGVRPIEDLGLPMEASTVLKGFLRQTSGLLLLTGPAGSGKTTTVYSCLRYLLEKPGRHVITIEDPVEQIIPGAMQTEINEARGLTFACAARHLLRQDPQVLVIGEIRDPETADLAIRATLTGHSIIATLHAGSARAVFDRLLAICSDRDAVIAALTLVLNQRLVRRLCSICRGAGCSACVGTGYRGRIPMVEWISIDEALRARLRACGPGEIAPHQTLKNSGSSMVENGLTSPAELLRVLGE